MHYRLIHVSFLWIALTSAAYGQHHHQPPPGAGTAKAVLLAGTGSLHHPVSTENQQAQMFFDQGLSMIYGFNHGEAVRSFRRAAELDSRLAMAYWGVAVALGPNINSAMEPDAHKDAWQALQQARQLRGSASAREKAYIDALSVRYSADPKAEIEPMQRKYADAMRELARKYPDDLDAQTLFAESLMNLYPWKLWTLDGKPSPVTEEAVRVLENVLAIDPDHLGANHYYIHAVEASSSPARALPSAIRLGKLAPSMGHIVHMPAHIFMRTGDYEAAAQANIDATAADRAYLAAGGVGGFYQALYAHNLHFLSAAYSMQGRYREAQQAAEECLRALAPLAIAIPGFEGPATAALLVPVRFRDWDRVLKIPEPKTDQLTMHNLWHFARAMAFAARADPAQAAVEHNRFLEGIAKLPPERTYGLNLERSVMQLPLMLLEAKIALARKDWEQAIGHLKEAVAAEDSLSYNEPPDWYYPPSREALGSVLLQAGRHVQAEAVFREDLRRNARNGRSFYGLLESLRAQGRTDEAALIEPLYRTAWSKADRPLTVTELF